MTKGPLPPHERPWRHPSELPAPLPEPITRSGRVLILSTATVSLLLVGALAIALAPRQSGGFDALAPGGVSIASLATGQGEDGEAPTEGAITQTDGLGPARGGAPPSPASVVDAGLLLATPIGDGVAVTTRSALGQAGSRDGVDAGVADASVPEQLAAVLPSGDAVTAELLATSGDVAYLRIVGDPAHAAAVEWYAAGHDEGTDDHFALARDTAVDSTDPTVDVVYLLFDGEYAPIDRAALAGTGVGEATPAYDDDGMLIGLCTNGPDGVAIVALVQPPPAGVAPRSTTPTSAAAPSTEAPPTSEVIEASEPEPSSVTAPPDSMPEDSTAPVTASPPTTATPPPPATTTEPPPAPTTTAG